jgi:NADPH:quinone reductase-like Zn-dependent oxidoreductase
MASRQALHDGTPTLPVIAPTMRALVQDRYGGPDVLHVADVRRPAPGHGEVLVRVEAASVNARDWHVMRGEPRIARLMDRSVFGWRGPRLRVRGTDYAGVVESVGPAVTDWAVGDRVFGEASETLAEYVAAPVGAMARVPDAVSMEQAAALPLAATTALECLRAADPRAGSTVLVNGASGGVGTFVVQLATHMGLHVTAVCSARNSNQARSLGADRVIDYASEDFVAGGCTYDLVIDLVGNRSLRDLRGRVRPSGSLVLSGGGVPGEGRFVGPIGLLMRAQLARNRRGPTVLTPLARPDREVLEDLAVVVARGTVSPVIDRTFGLDDASAALHYLESEHARGKVVVSLGSARADHASEG